MSSNKLVHLSTEYFPVFKKGGLGDFLYSFTKELTKSNFENLIILPHYEDPQLKIEERINFNVEYSNLNIPSTASIIRHENKKVILLYNDIISSMDYKFSAPYWEEPNIAPYVVFAKTALVFLKQFEDSISIIYSHDWQTGGIHFFEYLKMKLNTKYITIIHNYEHKGMIRPDQATYLPSESSEIFRFIEETYQNVSLSTLNLHYSDKIIVVSTEYKNEILMNQISHTGNYILQKNREKTIGIINGVDYDTWSPQNDTFLNPQLRYTGDIADFKKANKEAFFRTQHVKYNKDTMLYVFNSRLSYQKGLSLILTNDYYDYNKELFKKISKLNAVFVIHGTADESSARYIEDCKKIFKDEKIRNVILLTPYQETTAHHLMASCDCLIHPSIFEPCGLSQLYALKYGSIPIVTNTGGLKETIIHYDSKTSPDGYGFVMNFKDHHSLYECIFNSYQIYQQPAIWYEIQKRALNQDFSWDKSILNHIKVIHQVNENNS